MIKTTIGDLLDGKLDTLDTGDHHLYVVRDGDVIFYVGRSKCVITRLLGHCGRGDWIFYGKSELGRMIDVNLPDARDWQIELWTITEIGAFDVDDAEQVLIERYVPHLNVMGKRQPSGPLPECYKTPWARIANEGVKLG